MPVLYLDISFSGKFYLYSLHLYTYVSTLYCLHWKKKLLFLKDTNSVKSNLSLLLFLEVDLFELCCCVVKLNIILEGPGFVVTLVSSVQIIRSQLFHSCKIINMYWFINGCHHCKWECPPSGGTTIEQHGENWRPLLYKSPASISVVAIFREFFFVRLSLRCIVSVFLRHFEVRVTTEPADRARWQAVRDLTRWKAAAVDQTSYK